MRRPALVVVASLVVGAASLTGAVGSRAAAPPGFTPVPTPDAAAPAEAPGPAVDPDGLSRLERIAARRVIVTYRDGMRLPAEVHAAAGATPLPGAAGAPVEVVTTDDPATAIAAYRARPEVLAAEPDGVVQAYSAPPDEGYYEQWNLQPVSGSNRGTSNWEPVYPAFQGEGVRVAVLDTGLRAGGPDQPERIADGGTTIAYPQESGCTPPSPPWNDDVGHGTHVAGTVAQRTGNASTTPPGFEGVAGVAPRAVIVPIKILDCSGGGLISNTIEGIDLAVARGAQVINLSLGGVDVRAGLCEAVERASRSAIVVAANGNESTSAAVQPVSFPAACPRAMAVSAVRYDGSRPPYGNAGCETSLAAPGGDTDANQFQPPGSFPQDDGVLQETFQGDSFGYFWLDGTSMSAPHVSGAAALLFAARPGVSRVSVIRALQGGARDLGPPGADPVYGHGALDIAASVDLVSRGVNPVLGERGYWMAARDGGLFNFGACFLGSVGGRRLNSPVVGATSTTDGAGYWMVAADGGIFSFGSAGFHGSTGAIRLNQPIVGIAPTPSGNGYWLVATDGGIFSFGDARFHGSTGAIRLNQPIVGMAATPSGNGYWLVARDGGIFSFGDARFHGSTGAIRLNQPIVGMAATPSGNGYWLVATDGGIFAFGDARFHGSTGAIRLNRPIIGMGPTPGGGGYWLAADDGGVFNFGDARFRGSAGGLGLSAPVVAFTVAADRRTG